MESDNGAFAFRGFEEGDVLGVVMEKVFAEGCRAEGASEDGEVLFEVGVAVGEVFPDFVAGKVEFGGLVEAGGEAVSGGLAF